MAKANYGDLPINHSEEPIRLFKSDFLEFFTHIHPAVVLLLYVPVVLFFLARAFAEQGGGAIGPVFGMYAIGLMVWTFSEYMLHRYLFHWEPKTPFLSIPLAALFFLFFKTLVGTILGAPLWVAPLFAGFVTGYIAYDMMHYAEHHLSMKWGFFKFVKRYHLLHHYKTPEHRFGVSSPLWDYILGTKPKDR
jgi:hypothetical protein